MIPICEPLLGAEELKNVIECVETGWISSQGKFVRQFEAEFSEYIGTQHGLATSSGTTALHLALVALGIGKGDEVIMPTLTFVATANAVVYTGATPVFVDSNPSYWCIDPLLIEEAITKKTKAIIPVHLYGHPCDMDTIGDIADEYNLYIIEDAAEAHGAEYKGKKVGSFGEINCFSFYGNKIITTGEGGMCLTDNSTLAHKMKVLRDHGMNPDKRYWHDYIGFNYRMTNLQAAIGVAQLHWIDELIDKRRRVAEMYNTGLCELDITLPPQESWAESVSWIYTVLVEDRARLASILNENGIDTRPMFYPIHLFPPYLEDKEYPVAEELSAKGISLPSGPALKGKDIVRICEVISENRQQVAYCE